MRRRSPYRSPPNRRRATMHSMSPLSRSQPAPPGDERGRKSGPWIDNGSPQKGRRPRSRSREWINRSRETMDREPPFVNLGDNGRNSFRPRDYRNKPSREFETEKFKLERNRHHEDINQPLEETYLDHHADYQRENFNNLIVEPPLTYGQYNQLEIEKPVVVEQVKVEEKESAAQRIARLEKLVEKLVEGNAPKSTSAPDGWIKGKIPELIPSNPRFTTSMWLNAIDEECLHRSLNEGSRIRFIEDQMTGIIKAWFKTVSSYSFTWPELKLLITKCFPDNTEFAQTLKLLVGREKASGETITQYFFSKLYLCEACKITGENAVSCLIDGLNSPFMQQDARAQNFLTPETLYSEYLSSLPDHEVSIPMDREILSEYPQQQQQQQLDFTPSPEVIITDQQQRGRDRRYNRHDERDEDRCYTCNKRGHYTRDCRHAPICYACKKKGHIAAKCPYNEEL